ncbi:hypothetical protein ABIE62_000789 [Porphyrobacter sp. MBR-155]|jgi:hypothetical protein|uniref:hypothetical protein n=1 Tax=Porphyrobacter sp. MBR-155 TaxID=3156464 RepID=UPI003398042B
MNEAMNKLRALVEALYSNTTSGALAWAVQAGSDVFFTSIGDRRLDVFVEEGEREEDVWIIIYNRDGDKIESFSDTFFGKARPARTPHDNYYSLMKDLYDAAGRNARGADKIVNELLEELGVEGITEIEDIRF